MVGASVFYNDVAGLEADGHKQRTGSQSSLDRLDQELKVRSAIVECLEMVFSYLNIIIPVCLRTVAYLVICFTS